MATILRVKRRVTEEPAASFCIRCKRMKRTDGEDDVPTLEEIDDVVAFAGTLQSKDDPVSRFLLEPRRPIVARNRNPKKRVTNLEEKIRKESKKNADVSRFKLVSTRRNLNVAVTDEDVADSKKDATKFYNLLDVVEGTDGPDVSSNSFPSQDVNSDVITCNGVPMVPNASASPQEFVYDIYLTDSLNLDDYVLQHSMQIEKCTFNSDDGYDVEDDESVGDEDEDSNDENYYKNEYPEENSDFENDVDVWRNYDEDPLQDFGDLNLGDDSASTGYDSELYGLNYARYKAQKLKEFGE